MMTVDFLVGILVLINFNMSISADQAVEAAIFLTLYRDAINTLQYRPSHSVNLQTVKLNRRL